MHKERLFGTDGIRGIPGDYPLTDGMLFKIGRSAAKLLLHRQQGATNAPIPQIIIGNDTRLSGYKLETILRSGITSCGVNVLLGGVVPTPGLAFLTRKFKADMGLMISASHNRPEDNGIKFFSESGYKLSEREEQWMEDIIFSSLLNLDESNIYKLGSVIQVEEGQEQYIGFLKSSVSDLTLGGMKIVVDCGNGSVSNFAPRLFRELGAEVISVGDRPNGTNINVGFGVLHPEKMAEIVTKFRADIGFAFDGDGDRLIMSDEKGNVLDGDYIMAIIGLHLLKQNRLPKKTIVSTVMSNCGFEVAIRTAGGTLLRTDVGDKYVLERMREQGFAFGGEQSGHVIFLEHSTTGDSLITALQVLKTMKETGRKLSQLAQCMNKFPQVLVNVEVKQRKPLESVSEVCQAVSDSNKRLKGNGRILVRYSGTEPVARIMVEGKDMELIEEIANCVAGAIRKKLGSGRDCPSTSLLSAE
ncbi:phosphoglucosamine mutase [Candidatus Omnitrophota bacterium]